MELINMLPELLEKVLMNMTCMEIIDLSSKIPKIETFCDQNNIIEKRKFLGFPRKSGHCYCYDAYDSCLNNESSITYINMINSDNFDDLFDLQEGDDHENIKILRDPPRMLEILEDFKDKLVYGDLVFYKEFNSYNRHVCIFDGIKLLYMGFDPMDGYGTLPQQFSVLTNNVPMNYWDIKVNENGEIIQPGLNNNSCIWLNISQIREQLLNNINNTKISDIFLTSFTHNDINYIIYCHFTEYQPNIERVKKEISERNVILLSRNDFTGTFEEIQPHELLFDVAYTDYY